MLMDLVKTKLSDTTVVWSMPMAFMKRADWLTPGPNLIHAVDAMVAAHQSNSPYNVEDLCFFLVIRPRPEQKKRVLSSHVDVIRSVVKIRQMQLMEADSGDDGVFTLLANHEQDSVQSLDVRTLATFMDAQLIGRWSIVSQGATPSLGSREHNLIVLDSLLRGADTVQNVATTSDVAVDGDMDEDMPGINYKEPLVLTKIVRRLMAMVASQKGYTTIEASHVPLTRPPVGPMKAAIDHLVAQGLMEVTINTVGKTCLRLQPAELDWTVAIRVNSPVPLFKCECDNIEASTSKLECILQLLQQHWSITDAAPICLLPEGPQQIPKRMVLRSMLAYKAVLKKSDVFSRGAPSIQMNQCEGYYKCLLVLPDLKPLHARADFDKLSNADFEKLCKGIHVASALLALEDADVEPYRPPPVLALEDGDPNDPEPPAHAVAPEHDPLVESFEIPPVVCCGLSVSFDNCTHDSGMRRVFITCHDPSHGRCQKYRFLHHHPNTNSAIAYLFAWTENASMFPGDHLSHYGHIPSAEDIASWQALLL